MSDRRWNTFQNFEIDIWVRFWKPVEETVQPVQKPTPRCVKRRAFTFATVCLDNGSPQRRDSRCCKSAHVLISSCCAGKFAPLRDIYVAVHRGTNYVFSNGRLENLIRLFPTPCTGSSLGKHRRGQDERSVTAPTSKGTRASSHFRAWLEVVPASDATPWRQAARGSDNAGQKPKPHGAL